MDLGLKGLNVLVTGASKGIGRHCAEIFAAEGANVSICARDQKGVTAAIEALKAHGTTVIGRAVDVADKNALAAWVKDSAASMGGIDIVVGNVSALAVGDDEAAWQAGFETDMMHSVRLVNAAMPWLEKSKAASITLISSVSGREVDFTGPAYGAFKAALVHYAQGWRSSWRGRGSGRTRSRRGTPISTAASGSGSRGTTRSCSPRPCGSTPRVAWRSPRRSRGAWCSSRALRRVSRRGRTSSSTGR
jgi:NAD(P)-dependent dehydrogenase (short-subunit alcohol dehydrogenase family)